MLHPDGWELAPCGHEECGTWTNAELGDVPACDWAATHPADTGEAIAA